MKRHLGGRAAETNEVQALCGRRWPWWEAKRIQVLADARRPADCVTCQLALVEGRPEDLALVESGRRGLSPADRLHRVQQLLAVGVVSPVEIRQLLDFNDTGSP